MGCDIHMYTEYKKHINENSVWVSADFFRINPYYQHCKYEEEFKYVPIYDERNYYLFATLAGVRKYSDKIITISPPRGIPGDTCSFIRNQSEILGEDGHSHSYFTLKELKDFQATEPIMYYSGLMTPENAKNLDEKNIFPTSWCQGTSNKTYVYREWERKSECLVPIIKKLEKYANGCLQYEWQEYDPKNEDKIRIVFWFDN